MGKAPGTFPVTYTASPQLKDGAIPAPSWQYWAHHGLQEETGALVACVAGCEWMGRFYAIFVWLMCHVLNDTNDTM